MDKKGAVNRKAGVKTITELITDVSRSDLRKCFVPQELAAGWPYISMKNRELCITIPYYGVKRLGAGKGNLLYPILYTITAVYKNGKIVNASCLAYDKEFKEVDYTKPCGMFKHEAIKDYTKELYIEERNKLFSLYDELLQSLINRVEFKNEAEFRRLFNLLMEPGEYPIYVKLAPKFFGRYCGGTEK